MMVIKSYISVFTISLAVSSAVRGPNYDDVRALGLGNATIPVTTDRTAIFHNPAGLGLIKDKFQCSLSPLSFSLDGIFFQILRQMAEHGDKLGNLDNVDQSFLDMINEYDGHWAGFGYIPEISFATRYMGLGMYSVLPIGVRIESGHLIPKLALRAERDVVITWAAGIPLRKDRHYIGASVEYIQRTPLEVAMTKYSETFRLFDDISNSPLGIVGDYSKIRHGVSIDVGFMHQFVKGFRFAWDVKDIFGVIGGEFVFPPQVDLGCAYYFPQLEKVDEIKNLVIAFELSNLAGLEPATGKYEHFAKKIHIGAEIDMHYGALRLGISQGYPTLGVGLHLGIFKIDYAYFTEELGYYPGQLPLKRHALTAGVDFTIPPKRSNLTRVRPEDLYNRAMNLFVQGNYYDALILFGKLIAEYPDFFKNDLVRLHIGECEEYMDMRKAAAENYLRFRVEFPESPVLPYTDLGLMRIWYRNGDSAAVAQQFARLNTSQVSDSLKQHARYYQAQAFMHLGHYTDAITLLEGIEEYHPEYVFAQHSLGVAYAALDSMERAVAPLSIAAQTAPQTKAQEEMVNRSLVLLGYLFYGGTDGSGRLLPNAVAALSRVPATSYYYEDALLGLAWCGVTAGRNDDCLRACSKIKNISTKTVLQCEALLLEGYVRIIQKKFNDAIAILREASALIRESSMILPVGKDAAELEYLNTRKTYNVLAARLNAAVLKRETKAERRLIDSLRTPQKEYEKKAGDLRVKLDEFDRLNFFARNAGDLKRDIDYALIKAEAMAERMPLESTLKKAAEKTKEIDSEMEKLEKELKNLENERKEAPEPDTLREEK